MNIHYLIVFLISLICISLELFLTRVLNLKTWNHVVYIIIPFAMLGYGIGANLCLIFRNYFIRCREKRLIALLLILFSILCLESTFLLIRLPIYVDYLVNFLGDFRSISMLLMGYTIIMIPFVVIGFIVVYIFSLYPRKTHALYFFDLIGAGFGAFLFYPLINYLEVVPSITILCLATLFLGLLMWQPKMKWAIFFSTILIGNICLFGFQEEKEAYTIDNSKGWEWMPGYFPKESYDYVVSQWHPLGRSDFFRIKNREIQADIYSRNPVTFQINLKPAPEMSYVSTNFLAGTPIFNLSERGIKEHKSKIRLFSQVMEVPYLILDKPRVLIIGAGGGRDIFIAQTHGSSDIVGAEINPSIHRQMSKGGYFYNYSNGIYDGENTKIYNVDARHLVKSLPDRDRDFIILNGVDTFAGLSMGAYAYAESYLYTKEAVVDYLRVLNEKGVLTFIRGLSPSFVRESLRLFVIVLDALRGSGMKNPSDHILIGSHEGWSLMLVKKTPFTPEEREMIENYLKDRNSEIIFTQNKKNQDFSYSYFFDDYWKAFKENKERYFLAQHPYDISVVTDDRPFFYKYYKFNEFNPFKLQRLHHSGTIIFMTQAIVLAQALIFIAIFIFFPLYFFKRRKILLMPPGQLRRLIVFFSSLGLGFMLIEISLMQKFVLLLGSPIYSISVTLSSLLIASGVGSLMLEKTERLFRTKERMLTVFTCTLFALIYFIIFWGSAFLERFMGSSFFIRSFIACLFLFPVGFILGIFFPAGLKLVSRHEDFIAWAWGINAGFSVLGSILAIILGQFFGFSTVLQLAAVTYLVALLSFRNLKLQ